MELSGRDIIGAHLQRRGPRPYIAPSLNLLRAAQGPVLRIRDLSAMTGLSQAKLRNDWRNGCLAASQTNGGLLLVEFVEAQRYVRDELGLLKH